MTPVIPATSRSNSLESSIVFRNSTHEALIRNSSWATSSPGTLGAGQEDWDHVEVLVPHPPVDGDLDLLILPGPHAVGPEERDAGLALHEAAGESRLELAAGEQLPAFQIELQSLRREAGGEFLDHGAVEGVVGEEGVVGHADWIGNVLIHRRLTFPRITSGLQRLRMRPTQTGDVLHFGADETVGLSTNVFISGRSIGRQATSGTLRR